MGEHTKKTYLTLASSRSDNQECMFPLNSNMNKHCGNKSRSDSGQN